MAEKIHIALSSGGGFGFIWTRTGCLGRWLATAAGSRLRLEYRWRPAWKDRRRFWAWHHVLKASSIQWPPDFCDLNCRPRLSFFLNVGDRQTLIISIVLSLDLTIVCSVETTLHNLSTCRYLKLFLSTETENILFQNIGKNSEIPKKLWLRNFLLGGKFLRVPCRALG